MSNFIFTFVKRTRTPLFITHQAIIMKDRIRKVMESQRMTQQEFADFIHISPASLSSIFTGRTRPTLAIVEAVKNALPDISTDWLMFGTGNMWITPSSAAGNASSAPTGSAIPAVSEGVGEPSLSAPTPHEPILNFDGSLAPPAQTAAPVQHPAFGTNEMADRGVKVKNIDIRQRTITEIRIFFSDQTWETFVPKK